MRVNEYTDGTGVVYTRPKRGGSRTPSRKSMSDPVREQLAAMLHDMRHGENRIERHGCRGLTQEQARFYLDGKADGIEIALDVYDRLAALPARPRRRSPLRKSTANRAFDRAFRSALRKAR